MIKEDRIITRKNLKQLCVDFDLYTLGTSEEYEEMLKSAEYFLIIDGIKINFCFNTKEEAIYRAKPYWKAAKSIEILTVETKKYIEKTQETIK